jgi:hypothetical protein
MRNFTEGEYDAAMNDRDLPAADGVTAHDDPSLRSREWRRGAARNPTPDASNSDTPNSDMIDEADHAARHWMAAEPGQIALGSEQHKQLACRMFRETFNPYKPSIIDWPTLSPEARHRLINLPIWDIAVQTEGKARLRMLAYGQSLADPAWREAIEHNAWEEGRHKEVLSNLVAAYGIQLAPEPVYQVPRDPEWAYLVTGFSECVDSFFAFGLFEVAKRSGFFPPALVDTFEPVIQEEARHILLFANWLAWHRRRLPVWRRPWFELRVAAVWVFLAWERIGIARGMDSGGMDAGNAGPADNNFTLTGSKAVSGAEISPAALMAVCLDENERRFAGYDSRLLRPTTTPAIARAVCWFTRSRRRPVAARRPAK